MNATLIVITLLLYFSVLMLISRLTSRRHHDNKAFFSGNRQSPWFLVAFGMIGASLSGVTFISVPGMVSTSAMTYLQTCMGFFVGYIVIAHVLLPLYYKLNLVSIYTYLDQRFGIRAYKTGSWFFFISKLLGAAARLYIVCLILQRFVLDQMGVPFPVTVIIIVVLIWLYTHKSGIRTIVWTDSLQTFCLLAALGLILWKTAGLLDLDFAGVVKTVRESDYSRIFVFDDWVSRQNFFKQFFSGIFITIVMTGLDQDMMQKNLSCKNLRAAQKNVWSYGFAFIPVNLIFLTLGILLMNLLPQLGLEMPAKGDDLLPMLAAGGYLGDAAVIFFTVGIVSAAFSSADSALTALTTSFSIDILDIGRFEENRREKYRKWTHVGISVAFVLCIIAFDAFNNPSILDTIYVMASYTYGPLLGLFVFGISTHRKTRDALVPAVAISSPLLCILLDVTIFRLTGYKFGYELLMLNGLLTFAGLLLLSKGCGKIEKNV